MGGAIGLDGGHENSKRQLVAGLGSLLDLGQPPFYTKYIKAWQERSKEGWVLQGAGVGVGVRWLLGGITATLRDQDLLQALNDDHKDSSVLVPGLVV